MDRGKGHGYKTIRTSNERRATIIGCVIGLLLLASIMSYLVIQRTARDSGSSSYVQIMQNGECIETIDLTKVEKPYRMTIENSSGGYNVVEIGPDGIGIVEADCPDKLCQKQGFIENSSKTIVCLPHRLVIEFVDKDDSKEEFDVVIQ